MGGSGRTAPPPTRPAYDYAGAARDALAFAALFDRLMQNLRRFLGYDVQYFAAVEPQRRLAPHIHIAMRGTVSRAELRRVLAATYHQVWWPARPRSGSMGDERPVWDEQTCTYVDPYTGEVLPTWDEALDAIGAEDQPRHVARFGDRFDAQGVLSGSKDAARCIGYLTKYLTKQVADCHQADTDAEQAHAARLAEALRYEPCSPRCANWLRYGIQPKGARPGLVPGACKGKAHDRQHLGYAGRRVLTSRKWSGKTLLRINEMIFVIRRSGGWYQVAGRRPAACWMAVVTRSMLVLSRLVRASWRSTGMPPPRLAARLRRRHSPCMAAVRRGGR